MVVDIKRQVVKVEETQPVLLGDWRVAAVRVKLIGNPHVQYDVKGNARVREVLGHDVWSDGIYLLIFFVENKIVCKNQKNSNGVYNKRCEETTFKQQS